jgi:hypothetical protein
MYVPSDSFNGMSPERKASQALLAFFTFVAVRIVQAQLGGSGRDNLGSYNVKASEDLQALLEDMPMKDCDAWIAALLKKNELLGVRIMEVRASYAAGEFEWDYLQKITKQEIEKGNTSLTRKHASEAFKKAFEPSKDT